MATIAARTPLSSFAPNIGATVIDPRFRQLLGEANWAALPPAVRARFGRKALATQTISYIGEVVECRMSRLGRLLANLCRLVGAPLPLNTDTNVAASVCVTEDAAGSGQFWTRQYCRRAGFPQVIHSSKRFAGPTGLEEYLGRGLGMALRVEALDDGIAFVSDHYFLELGRLRLRLTRLLAPGVARVTHRQVVGSSFLFGLELTHPLAGTLVRQEILFDDVD